MKRDPGRGASKLHLALQAQAAFRRDPVQQGHRRRVSPICGGRQEILPHRGRWREAPEGVEGHGAGLQPPHPLCGSSP